MDRVVVVTRGGGGSAKPVEPSAPVGGGGAIGAAVAAAVVRSGGGGGGGSTKEEGDPGSGGFDNGLLPDGGALDSWGMRSVVSWAGTEAVASPFLAAAALFPVFCADAMIGMLCVRYVPVGMCEFAY